MAKKMWRGNSEAAPVSRSGLFQNKTANHVNGRGCLRYLSEPAETKEFYGLSLKQTLPENKLPIFPTNLRNLSYFTEG